MLYGAANGLINKYDEKLMKELRHIYYGGLPASILLLHEGLCNGKCYDRVPLLTLALSEYDYQVVYADIDSIKLNPKYLSTKKENPSYAEHCFVEATDEDGITWVFDTSSGLIYEKNLYYKIEKPKIRHINSKERTIEFTKEVILEQSNIEQDKYMLPLMIPCIEKSLVAIQPIYQDMLVKELEILKREMHYEELCKFGRSLRK